MSVPDVIFWVILPYVAITTFIVGHIWRYRSGQFRWTSQSSQLLDRSILGWASPAFHYGALAAIGGHVIGLCIPESFTAAVGISESFYRWFAGVAGGIAGAVTLIGFLGLLYRRTTSVRVRQRTSWMDMFTYFLLTFLIVLGCWMTFRHTLFTSDPFNYRPAIGDWWRSIFYLNPDVAAVHGSPFVYQLHAIVAWAFWGAFTFSRLVHAWSIPLQYLGRPYILYRGRFPATRPSRRLPRPFRSPTRPRDDVGSQ